MGKAPVRVKEIVYTLSPFEQSIMSGLFKDIPHKAKHYASTWKHPLLWCILPLYGVMSYCENYREKEKIHHRF